MLNSVSIAQCLLLPFLALYCRCVIHYLHNWSWNKCILLSLCSRLLAPLHPATQTFWFSHPHHCLSSTPYCCACVLPTPKRNGNNCRSRSLSAFSSASPPTSRYFSHHPHRSPLFPVQFRQSTADAAAIKRHRTVLESEGDFWLSALLETLFYMAFKMQIKQKTIHIFVYTKAMLSWASACLFVYFLSTHILAFSICWTTISRIIYHYEYAPPSLSHIEPILFMSQTIFPNKLINVVLGSVMIKFNNISDFLTDFDVTND